MFIRIQDPIVIQRSLVTDPETAHCAAERRHLVGGDLSLILCPLAVPALLPFWMVDPSLHASGQSRAGKDFSHTTLLKSYPIKIVVVIYLLSDFLP